MRHLILCYCTFPSERLRSSASMNYTFLYQLHLINLSQLHLLCKLIIFFLSATDTGDMSVDGGSSDVGTQQNTQKVLDDIGSMFDDLVQEFDDYLS